MSCPARRGQANELRSEDNVRLRGSSSATAAGLVTKSQAESMRTVAGEPRRPRGLREPAQDAAYKTAERREPRPSDFAPLQKARAEAGQGRPCRGTLRINSLEHFRF